MARIRESEIERIKRETDLAALVRSRGIELAKHGNGHLAGLCPFHKDEEPSLIVTPEKGLFHCMGCGAAGNAIQFVEKYDGVSFRHAYELLAEGAAAFVAPVPLSPDGSGPRSGSARVNTVRRLENPLSPNAEDAALLGQVVDYYHQRLLKTPAALEYLKHRGLYDEEALEHFRLGYADRSLGLRLPHKNRQEGGLLRERLQRLGILRGNGHEHLSGSIVLPIFSAEGHLAEMYGRRIAARLPKGTPKHLYLPGPHAGIWNAEALDELELVLCEAPFDALTFWINGIRNVTFIFGTEGFPDYLLDALDTHRIQRVRLAYDADEAGNRAALRDAERLAARGIEAWRIKFPLGMDANDYALKVRPAPKSLRVALSSAVRMTRSAAVPDAPDASRARPHTSSISLAAKSSQPEAGPPSADAAKNEDQPSASPKLCVPDLERAGSYHFMRLGEREYRIGGLEKNNSLEVMKVALRLRHKDTFHLDSFDLLQDTQRRRFIERAHEETKLDKDLIKRDLGKLLVALEELQTQRLAQAVEVSSSVPEMTEEERKDALALLEAPDLIGRISEAFDICGLVGEQTNRLAAYLACTSRKLDKPLALIIQSTSAAGKSTLMEAVLSLFPEEERVKYSAMTGQSLYYLGESDLKHKILAIVEEEGADKASYALKLLQSEGELMIASTGKDPHTGRMETQEYHVEGPVMIFLTTTAIEIDEELLNRCLVLTVDETREQTERIHALQRQARTLEGLRLRKRRSALLALLRNAQRLIEPLDVVNPYAGALTFTAVRTRTRRDHEKYLTLIDAIALLHQHQRARHLDRHEGTQSEYIQVTLEDIELANRLAPELLGRSLDELSPQTRALLGHIKELVRSTCEARDIEPQSALFSRRQLRERTGWSEFQVRVHLAKLEALEYVCRRWGSQGARCAYELLADPDEPEETWHIGLIDVAALKRTATIRGAAVRAAKEPESTTAKPTSCTPEGTSCNFVKTESRSEKPQLLVING